MSDPALPKKSDSQIKNELIVPVGTPSRTRYEQSIQKDLENFQKYKHEQRDNQDI